MGSATVPSEFPVINLSDKKLVPGTSHWVETRDRVRAAMEEYSAFIVEYDTLSLDLHNAIMSVMKEPYAVPEDVKVKNLNHLPSHGFMTMEVDGYRIHEGLGIDYATEKDACEKFTRLMWPEGNDHFRDVAHSYAKVVAGLQQTVMKMLFESYGIDDRRFERHVASTRYLLRLLSYRKQRNGEANSSFICHTDKSFMTILHQNSIEGLDMRTPSGEWVAYEPSPTRFVVLAGDLLMIWSNDRIQSLYHRVVMADEEMRYSLGFFVFQTGTTEIPEEVVDKDHPLKYKSFDTEKLLRYYDGIEKQKRALNDMTKAYCAIDNQN